MFEILRLFAGQVFSKPLCKTLIAACVITSSIMFYTFKRYEFTHRPPPLTMTYGKFAIRSELRASAFIRFAHVTPV